MILVDQNNNLFLRNIYDMSDQQFANKLTTNYPNIINQDNKSKPLDFSDFLNLLGVNDNEKREIYNKLSK